MALRSVRPYLLSHLWDFARGAYGRLTATGATTFLLAQVQERLEIAKQLQALRLDDVGSQTYLEGIDQCGHQIHEHGNRIHKTAEIGAVSWEDAVHAAEQADRSLSSLNEDFRRHLERQRPRFAAARRASGRVVGGETCGGLSEVLDTHLGLLTSCQLLARQLLVVSQKQRERDDSFDSPVEDSGSDMDSAPSSVVQWTGVAGLGEFVADEARAFAREKFGQSPEVEVDLMQEGRAIPTPEAVHAPSLAGLGLRTDPRSLEEARFHPAATALVPAGYVQYVMMELLKNAIEASVRRFGALDVDEAPPVLVQVSGSATHAGFRVVDPGGGCSDVDGAMSYFLSGAGAGAGGSSSSSLGREKQEGEDWKFSKSFGAAFSGMGVGLPRCRVYSKLLGGSTVVSSLPGHGCTATVTFARRGDVPDVNVLELEQLLVRETERRDRLLIAGSGSRA